MDKLLQRDMLISHIAWELRGLPAKLDNQRAVEWLMQQASATETWMNDECKSCREILGKWSEHPTWHWKEILPAIESVRATDWGTKNLCDVTCGIWAGIAVLATSAKYEHRRSVLDSLVYNLAEITGRDNHVQRECDLAAGLLAAIHDFTSPTPSRG